MSIHDTCAKLQTQISELLQQRAAIRAHEQDLKIREYALSQEPQIKNGGGSAADLRSYLAKVLPAHLMPGNVGELSQIAWPFYFPVDIDFGVDPVLTSTSRVVSSFQVTQEASFLLLNVQTNAEDQGVAGFGGPYQIDIRDNQSSRQFNDQPIPVQMLGRFSLPASLPTPLMFQPNASVTLTMTTWLPAGETLNTIGSGRFQIMMSGLRVRVDDSGQILSSIFAQR